MTDFSLIPDTNSIKFAFLQLLRESKHVTDKTGARMLELTGVSFRADKPYVFRKPNDEYIARELEWYKSQSLNVNDIPPPVPSIWKAVATPIGYVNSNYGFLIYSKENGLQYENTLKALLSFRETRRAVMIYTRPTMHVDYNRGGMSDFVCTNAVTYMIRNGRLTAIVQMRSNDLIFGYLNDYAWQKFVLDSLVCDYNAKNESDPITSGDIIWNAASLHVYERHWKILQEESDQLYRSLSATSSADALFRNTIDHV